MRLLLLIVAIIFVAAAKADESKPVTIPLKDIWAHRMPGTKDVAELEPDAAGNIPKSDRDRPLTLEIRRALDAHHGEPQEAFAVLGSGRNALEEAHAVLTGQKQPLNSFPPEQ